MLKVGGHSLASSTPSRPAVPAPAYTSRPPRDMRSAVASMAAAIRGSWAATASGTVRSSPFMMRAISRVGCWSMSASSGRNASVVSVAS